MQQITQFYFESTALYFLIILQRDTLKKERNAMKDLCFVLRGSGTFGIPKMEMIKIVPRC